MAYVPRKRSHNFHIKVIIACLCVLLGIAGGVYLYHENQTKPEPALTICGLNESKTIEKLDKQYNDTYMISDYFYYGESLDLFKDPYVLDGKDDMSRKSVELVNVCDGETITYTMEAFVDRQIDMSELKPGFYELYVNDNLVKKRLTYKEAMITEPYTTIKRSDEVKALRLLAGKELLQNAEAVLDQDYLFLEVKSEPASSDSVDVFIDPYGHMLRSGMLDKGGEANGLKEYEETYEAATLLKAKLESFGLRVKIAKTKADETVNYYGDDGRMERAYESNARYYIELGLNSSTFAQYKGAEIYHSAYASETFANAIMYELKKNTGLTASNAYAWNDRSEGVASSALTEGPDKQKIYDALPTLRESGGRATGAALFSEEAKENSAFARKNVGMQAISINLFYMTNTDDVKYWNEHKNDIISELANAFVKAVRIAE